MKFVDVVSAPVKTYIRIFTRVSPLWAPFWLLFVYPWLFAWIVWQPVRYWLYDEASPVFFYFFYRIEHLPTMPGGQLPYGAWLTSYILCLGLAFWGLSTIPDDAFKKGTVPVLGSGLWVFGIVGAWVTAMTLWYWPS